MNRYSEHIIRSYLSLFSENLFDLISEMDKVEIFYHLSHQEEKDTFHRDQWGNWEFPFTAFDYREPYLDYFVQKKMDEFGLVQRRIWPDGKPFAICITHDLDHIGLNWLQESQRFRTRKTTEFLHRNFSRLTNFSTKFFKNHPLWCYERWIDFLEKFGFRSTFFIYSNPKSIKHQHLFDNLFEFDDEVSFFGKRMTVAEMVKKIDNHGFEIGLHGSYYSALDSTLFSEQKAVVEAIVGRKIGVTRQHFLRYDIKKTPDVHSNNGILVDSTLGYNRTIGFRAGTCMPYFLGSEFGKFVLEVPMLIMDGALFNANSLELNEDLAIKKSLQIMDQCEKVGGVLTINFHPNYIVNEKWWRVFKAIVKEANSRNAFNTSLLNLYEIIIDSSGLSNSLKMQ